MPFTGDNHDLPSGSLVSNGVVSNASQHNTPLTDISDSLSALAARVTGKQAASASLNQYSAVNPTAAGLALLGETDADAQLATLGGGAHGITVFKSATQGATSLLVGDFITPSAYGAVGDGLTNDATAINAALTACASSKKALLINKDYAFSATLVVPDGVTVLGGTGRLIKLTHTFIAMTIGDYVTLNGVRGYGATDGPYHTGSNLWHGVKISNSTGSRIVNCTFNRFGFANIFGQAQRSCTISNNLLYGLRGYQGNEADILFYSNPSPNNGYKNIISGNHCFSAGNVGIYINANGGDEENIFTNNIVIPMKPDLSGEFTHLAPGDSGYNANTDMPTATSASAPRNGIMISYTGGNAFRTLVLGNYVRNWNSAAIYSNQGDGTDSGHVIVANNNISHCCLGGPYANAGDLRSAILIGSSSARGTIIQSNCIDDIPSGNAIFVGESIDAITGAVFIIANNAGSNILDAASGLGKGIVISGNPLNVLTQGNIISSEGYAFVSTLTVANYTNLKTIDNVFEVSTNTAPLQTRNGATPRSHSIKDNTLRYVGVAAKTASLIGIDVNFADTEMEGNTYDNLHTSCRVISVPSGRHNKILRIRNNHHADGINGYTYTDSGTNSGDTAFIPVIGDTFDTITAPTPLKTARDICFFRASTRGGSRYEIEDTAVPLWGQWIVGDAILKSNVAAAGSTGWSCTTAGTGGTSVWKAHANVAA